jgi:hypothetical protein
VGQVTPAHATDRHGLPMSRTPWSTTAVCRVPARLLRPTDFAVIRAQPVFDNLARLTHQRAKARNNRTRVHIQTNTRTLMTHWGLPHLWFYRPGPFPVGNHVHM